MYKKILLALTIFLFISTGNAYSSILRINYGILSSVVSDEWIPTDIEGCVLWLVANTNTITLNGSDVAQWDDQSGNNFHATQGNATYQPAYSNGIVTFDGGDEYLTCVATNTLNVEYITVCMRWELDTADEGGSEGTVNMPYDNDSWDAPYVSYGNPIQGVPTGGLMELSLNVDGENNIFVRDDTQTFAQSNTYYNYFAIWDGDNATLYVDNVEKATDDLANGTIKYGSPIPQLCIGRAGLGLEGYYFAGSFKVIVIFNKALDATERTQMNTYLDTLG